MFAILLIYAVTGLVTGHRTKINPGAFKDVCKKCHYTNGAGYVPYPNMCGKFIQCWKPLQTYLVKSCPPGLHWDVEAEACNFPEAANCREDYRGHCCPEHWIRHGASCYLFVGNKRTWTEASHICATHRATLASVQTQDENDFIRGYLKVFADLKADMTTWLGGTDMEIEGTWRWSPSREKFTFTDWYPGQPDPNGDCVIIWPGHAYHWGDIGCHYLASFICEKT